MGPVSWTYPAEIFPMRVRAKAVSVAKPLVSSAAKAGSSRYSARPSHSGAFFEVGASLSPQEDEKGGQAGDKEPVDDDDLSTTSGRRHGALLVPEPEDYLLFNVRTIVHRAKSLTHLHARVPT